MRVQCKGKLCLVNECACADNKKSRLPLRNNKRPLLTLRNAKPFTTLSESYYIAQYILSRFAILPTDTAQYVLPHYAILPTDTAQYILSHFAILPTDTAQYILFLTSPCNDPYCETDANYIT